MSLTKIFRGKNFAIVMISATLGLAGVLNWMEASEDNLDDFDVVSMAKPNVPIAVDINAPEGLTEDPDQTTKIEAVVRQFKDIGDQPVTYHWNLPEGVEIQNGELSGVIMGLADGSATLSISVKGLSSEVQKNILLDLNTDMNGQNVGAVGVYSTHERNRDLSLTPRQPASKSWFQKAGSGEAQKGLPPKGVHF